MARKTGPGRGRGGVERRRGRAGSCGWTGVRLWTLWRRSPIHRWTRRDPQDPVDVSLERPLETAEDAGELLVALAHRLDLAHGVDDRRVVLPAEGAADRRQGLVGESLAEVHRHLAREGDVLGVVARLELHRLDLEMTGHELLDRLQGDRARPVLHEVLERVLRHRQIDGAAGEGRVGDEP